MNDKLEEWLRRNLNEDSRNVESVSPPPQGNFNKHLHKPKHKFQQTPKDKRTFKKPQLKIIPLGGLDEVGKNMTIFEYEEDIVIVDMGFEFPSEDLLGIDYVIPDVSYLEKNKKRIKGVIITHGHLDHIGGIPYLLPRLDFPPVYGTRLTIGLIEPKIKEFKLEKFAKLRVINPEEFIKLGKFLCSFFRVAHSIPDAVGIVLGTPAGKVVHTGDFKFDETPARNVKKADIHKMEMLGHQ
ncbi:ribonuclease J, partial [Candidatus Peregrinibacteria bacterium]|nr:ribonuclease J [Candidatus Peregrinibacteria bacterium]